MKRLTLNQDNEIKVKDIYGKNKPTEKQTEWLKSLNKQGYAVAVCYGCNEASEKILKYLKLGEINE